MKPLYAIFDFEKRVANRPTTQTAMEALHRSYTIKKLIGMKIKGLDIQQISLCMRWPGYQVLIIVSYRGEILHLHL